MHIIEEFSRGSWTRFLLTGYFFKFSLQTLLQGSPGYAAKGGIFRDRSGEILGCFASYFGILYSLHAELTTVMIAIEVAY